MSQSMAKLESGSGPDGINKASQNNVIFVDTSLDTHLALLVSDSDTVSDLKKKILYEHPLCFPSIGKIQIHALKVKRKGNFYHLSDSMYVKSAFDGVKNSWFLCVDASCSVEHGENHNSCIPASKNMLDCSGIRNSTAFDRVDLPHDGPHKRGASNYDDSSLPLVGSNQNAKENVPIADKYGSSDSGKEVLKVKDAPIHGFGEDTSQQAIIVPESSLINAGREVPFDMRMGNKDIADEPCRSSSSNTSKRSVSEIKRTNNLSKETDVLEKHDNCILDKFKNDVDVQCNKSSEETSKSRSYAKRKRKIEKKSGDQDSLKEMRALTCNSNKEISKAESASKHSAGNKQKTNAILDSISTEPVEDAHLLETNSSTGKSKKRRKKSSNPLIQLASALPASGKDVGEENSRVTVGIKHKDSSGERTAESFPRQGVQGATTSELRGLSVEEKQSDSVHEVGGNDKLTSSLVQKQKTNATLDSLVPEAFKNVLLATDSSNGKKKRKKKSSNPLNRAVTSVPSSEKDVEEESSRVTGGINWKDSSKEPHAASVPGKGVQGVMTPEIHGIYQKQKQCDSLHEAGENDKVPSSLDLDMSETEAGNVKSKNNASKEEAAVGVARMRNSKDSHFADLKGHQAVGFKELTNLESNIELSRPENGVLNDDDNFETDQTDRVEEARESLHNRNSKRLLSKKFKLAVGVETDMDAKEVIATSKLLDGAGLVEHRKSSKKERKKRKPEDSVGGTPTKAGIELVKSSEQDISSAEPQTKGKEISKTKTVSTSLLATVRETGDVNGDEMESLQQISKTQVNAENMDEKMRKKSKKKQNSTAKNLLDLQRKDQDVCHKDSADNQGEVEASSKMTNEKQGSGKKSQVGNYSTIQLQGDECAEHMHHTEKKLVKISRSEDLDLVGGTPIKSGIEHGKSSKQEIFSAEPLKTVNSDHSSEISKKEESIFSQTKGKEVSKTNTVSKSLLATGRDAGDVYGDEVQSLQKISKTRANTENMDEKMRKKSKKKQNSTAKDLLDVQTKAQDVGHKDPTPSADNQREVEASSKMTNEKQGSGGKSQAGNSSTIQLQGSLSKDECAEHMLHPEKKLLKVSRSGMKAPRSTKSDKFTSIPEDVRRRSVVNDSETSINSERKSEAFAVSKSNLGNSKNIVHQSKLVSEIQSGVGRGVRKNSVNDIGEVVNNSEQDKSLLAKSGAIFKDDSSGSSEDEDGMVNSDASTRTPSDNSVSSNYSDGESNANLNSPQNGSNDSKRKNRGQRSITKAFSSSGEKSMTLDTILRSSRRYKRAKLTATQSQQEDTESQPVHFVPDTQADL